MSKNRSITVKGTVVSIATRNEHDYISLSDMVRGFEGQGALIENWLRAKDTVLFLGVWEQLNNPEFNSLEFEGIKNEAGRNSFFLSVKKWTEKTDAIGPRARAGLWQHRASCERLRQLNAIAIAVVQKRSLLTSPAVKLLAEAKSSSRKPLATRAVAKKGNK